MTTKTESVAQITATAIPLAFLRFTANCQLKTANYIQSSCDSTMPTELEKQWMAAWRRAGPELERIRNEELRALSDVAATLQATWLGVDIPTESRMDSGLRQFQVWMKKWRNAGSE